MKLHKTTVTGRTHITRLLVHLQDIQCPLLLGLANKRQRSTAILAVNPDQSYVLLDGITLEPGTALPRPGQAVRVEASFHGESARFETRIVEAADMAGRALMRIALPEHIDYHQRRAYFRITMSKDLRIPVTLIHEEQGSLFGVLDDISLGGLGAVMEVPDLDRAVEAELCLIQLPGGSVFHSDLHLTNTRASDEEGRIRVGGRFEQPAPAQVAKLERFIRQCEREALQRRID